MATNQHYLVKQLSITNTDIAVPRQRCPRSYLSSNIHCPVKIRICQEAAPASAGFYLRLAPENDFVQDSTLNEKIYLSWKYLQCFWCCAEKLWVAEVVGTDWTNVDEIGQAIVSPLWAPIAPIQFIVFSHIIKRAWFSTLKKKWWSYSQHLI